MHTIWGNSKALGKQIGRDLYAKYNYLYEAIEKILQWLDLCNVWKKEKIGL